MIYSFSAVAMLVFAAFVGAVLGLSFYLGRKAKSSQGYFAAHGQIHWFINGIAFAGDYLSAASFLGICGMIAFYGYDGFLYSIGFLAGWVVALFVIAEPIKRLGKYTFADALDSRFNSRGIKLAAAISTLVVSIFYLIPQMVGAGALIKPLLGLPTFHLGTFAITPFISGVVLVGLIVILIVVTAGMVSTTWVQFIKGSLLVLFCGILTILLLNRGLTAKPTDQFPRTFSSAEFHKQLHPSDTVLPQEGPWAKIPFIRVRHENNSLSVWQFTGMARYQSTWSASTFTECQTRTKTADNQFLVNGLPQTPSNDLRPAGYVAALPDEKSTTGPLGPLAFLSTMQDSTIALPGKKDITENGGTTTIYFSNITPGQDVLLPGNHPTLFKGLKSKNLYDRLNFVSFMLALFCGTAALPHILIRYYTVKDQASARKSTIVGIASIGLFYILTLYLGLGAMTSGMLDPTDFNMSAPLFAKSFGELPFAIISAIAFTTVLGTVSGLILAAAGAVARDLLLNVFRLNMSDHQTVHAAKLTAVAVGVFAMVLAILFEKMNVSFLVGWAFNIAASANLPAIVMLLFWKRTTKQGIAASIIVGMVTSLTWILLSADAFKDLYGMKPESAPIPFNQPALITIPLSFLVLVIVSLFTAKPAALPASQP